VQRRHQKVVEECPSPFVTPELRAAMGETAVKAAEAIGYTNAGTVEFLVDAERNFYFLEMNTRLQVEHPITELVTGTDLVKEQIRIAAGEPISFRQEDLTMRGWAVEVRVCAEDPDNGFLPSVGRVDTVTAPGGPGVRLDSGLYPGQEVSLFYDSLLAKLITWGADRDQAIARLRQALAEFKIADLKTNLAFLGDILRDGEFRAGKYDTGLIPRMAERPVDDDLLAAACSAAVLVHHLEGGRSQSRVREAGRGLDPWKMQGRRDAVLGAWR
jgi:acetyl-CoA carboxylase biotin carboxylase subunit